MRVYHDNLLDRMQDCETEGVELELEALLTTNIRKALVDLPAEVTRRSGSSVSVGCGASLEMIMP